MKFINKSNTFYLEINSNSANQITNWLYKEGAQFDRTIGLEKTKFTFLALPQKCIDYLDKTIGLEVSKEQSFSEPTVIGKAKNFYVSPFPPSKDILERFENAMAQYRSAASTKFVRTSNGYSLIVDRSKKSQAANWLRQQGCKFRTFVRKGTVEFQIRFAPDAVIDRISKKYPLQ